MRTVTNICNCEEIRINEMKSSTIRICIIWLALIVFLYICIGLFYVRLDTKINFIWTTFHKKVMITLSFKKAALLNRLSTIHNYSFLEDLEKTRIEKKSIHHNYWLRYSLATIILVFIATIIFILFTFVFGSNIYTSLKYRKSFFDIPINRRTNVLKMAYNVIDRLDDENKIESICFNITNFEGYDKEKYEVNEEFERIRAKFRSSKINSNVPLESWNMIFDSIDTSEFFIRKGLSAALAYLKNEAMLYLNNPGFYSIQDIKEFFNDCYQMALLFDDVLDKNELATSRSINDNFLSLLIYAGSSITIIFVVFFLIYFAYFKKEILIISSINNTLSYLLEYEEKISKTKS